MLLDPASQRLRIRVARGVEPELWPKISVALGQGIAGRVAAEARPIHLRGKADATQFDLLRERVDVESALSLPLIHQGRVLGVINVHHPHRADVFSPEDIRFMEQLASLDAQIIARAQEHESLRSQAARYDAIREVQQLLRGPVVLEERLEDFCRFVSERAGGGIAQIFLAESDGSFRLCATSLAAGGLGGEYRIDDASGVDGQAIRARRPIWLRHEDGRLGYAALPLLAGHKMMGLLSIQLGREQSTPPSARFSWEEISAAAADAIARSDKEARMAARSERTQALNESSIRMLSCDDPNEVARLATSAAATLLDADHVVLRLQDPITRRYSIRSYSGAAEGPERESLFRLDKAVSVDTIHRSAVHRIPNASLDPRLAEFADSMRPVLAAPLQRDRQVIGTLSVYDKVALDRFLPSDFDEEDLQLFRRFASYVERALDHALSHQDSRQHRNFDEETGLANAGFLDKRLNEEISRAAGRENALALCVCRLENRSELLSESGPAHVGRVVALLAEALRTHVRPFDVLARLDLDEFAVLMPEPGRTPGERVFELARAVADTVSKHETLNQPVRIGLAFGYGVHPADGDDREALLHHARDPRIRMV
jgi:GAF domain-containing protein